MSSMIDPMAALLVHDVSIATTLNSNVFSTPNVVTRMADACAHQASVVKTAHNRCADHLQWARIEGQEKEITVSVRKDGVV